MRDNNFNFNGFCTEEFPQYKAYNKGLESLTNVELVSLIIGTGTEKNVKQARQLLNTFDNRLRNISKARLEELQVVQGIGDAKALSLQAAIELGKRFNEEGREERRDLGSSLALYNFLLPKMRDLDVEEGHLVLTNQNFKLIKHVVISHGGLTETALDVRLALRLALENNATIMALAHNHPSCSPSPSKNDDILTTQFAQACEIMRIMFMDHIIITDGAFYSYHDKGRI